MARRPLAVPLSLALLLCVPLLPSAEAAVDLRVRGCLKYVEEATALQKPFQGVTWELWEANGGPGLDVQLGAGLTDSAVGPGCFESDPIDRYESSSNLRDLEVRYILCGAIACTVPVRQVIVTSTAPATGTSHLVDAACFCDTRLLRVSARHYRDALLGHAVADEWTSATIPKVEIQYPCASCWIQYIPTSRRIQVPEFEDPASPTDVRWASDFFLHEYGHHVMWTVTGVIDGGDHWLCTPTTPTLAWVEGFADFFAVKANLGADSPAGGRRDHLYHQPDSATPGHSMEVHDCGGGATGAGEEMNVARMFWDLTDSAVDGHDTAAPSTPTQLLEALRACHSTDAVGFQTFSSCNWGTIYPGERCNLVRSGEQNTIPLNQAGAATVTSQPSFKWVRDTMEVSATLSDPDACANGNWLELAASSSGACSSPAWASTLGEGSTADSFDTRMVADGGILYGCARVHDVFGGVGAWDASFAPWRVDNALPTASLVATVVAPTSVEVDWKAEDPHSGLSGPYQLQVEYRPLLCLPIVLTTICYPKDPIPWTTVCSNQLVPAATWSGKCAVTRPDWGRYCYRLIVSDALGHGLTTPGDVCTLYLPVPP